MDREIMHDPEREGVPVSADTELGEYKREFETRVRQDTDEIYMRLNDEQTERQQLAGWLNMLFRDRRAHAYTRHLMETEARMSREAWVRSTDASDLVRGEGQVTALQGQVTALQAQVTALQGQQGLAGGPTQPELPEEAGWYSVMSVIEFVINECRLGYIIVDFNSKQMAPRRTTRSTADQETVNATSVTNAQLQAMIDQGVTAALAARDALRSTNGDDSYNSGTSVRRKEQANRECTYTDFLKCQPLP
nr:hypothetical protein [Tanacetum cinerariifolium]